MGAPLETGAETTSEATDQAPAAIALIGPGGTLERATMRFLDRYGADEECLSAHQRKIDRIIAGEIDHVAVMLDGDVADVSAVIASDTQRYALVSVPLPEDDAPGDGPNPVLDKPIEDSAAVVWLKDLDGRYLRVNSRYVEELQTGAEHICGKTDAELALSESIEGMRQGRSGGLAHEPLELEYTVGACEDRPPYSVVRFALRNREGKPIAVCGVAAPLSQAWRARAECDRLMRIERWSRLDEAELREELLEEWGLAPLSETLVASSGKNGGGDGEGAQFAAIAAELDNALATSARLDRELAEERRQVMALREASILSARRAHELLGTVTAERARAADLEHAVSRAEARAVELEGELAAERSRAERVEARSAEAAETQRHTIDNLQLELVGLKEELERTRAAMSEAPTPELLARARAEADESRRAAEDAEAALEAERERAGRAEAALADLREAGERTESETSAALAAEKERGQALDAELAAARKELAASDEELAATREEVERSEQAAQEQVERARQSAREEVERAQRALRDELARAHEAAQEEIEQARQAAAQAGAERVARAEADAQKTLAGVREELSRARTELDLARADLERARTAATESSAALADEQRRAAALQSELAAVQAELERLRGAMAESADEHHGRIAEAEAARAQARTEAAELATELETERKTVESLQTEVAAVQAELERLRGAMAESADEQHGRIAEAEAARAQARTEAAELAAELETERKTVESLRAEIERTRAAGSESAAAATESSTALADEQRRAGALQSELAAVQAELERLRGAMAESADEQHGRIAEAEAARAQARTEAAELATELETERQTIESLRAELHSVRQAGEAAADEDPERERLSAALAAEQQRVLALQAEVESVRAEAEEALAAAHAKAPPAAEVDAPTPTRVEPDAPTTDGPHWNPASQRALARALAEVAEWRMALQQAVKTLTGEGGWDAAIAFCPDDRRRLLECVAISTCHALAETTFETQGWQHRPDIARREFGSAWSRPEPSSVTDLGTAEDRLLKAAVAHGMGSAALVPVHVGGETIAILCLLSRVSAPPTDELMVSLDGVGLQVGAMGHLLNAAGAPRWRLGRL